jgi:hypothetical protein
MMLLPHPSSRFGGCLLSSCQVQQLRLLLAAQPPALRLRQPGGKQAQDGSQRQAAGFTQKQAHSIATTKVLIGSK